MLQKGSRKLHRKAATTQSRRTKGPAQDLNAQRNSKRLDWLKKSRDAASQRQHRRRSTATSEDKGETVGGCGIFLETLAELCNNAFARERRRPQQFSSPVAITARLNFTDGGQIGTTVPAWKQTFGRKGSGRSLESEACHRMHP